MKLKLQVKNSVSFSNDPPQIAPASSPSAVPTSAPKTTLKLNNLKRPAIIGPDSSSPNPKRTKVGRIPKASKKALESQKAINDAGESDHESAPVSKPRLFPKGSMLKIRTSSQINAGLHDSNTPKVTALKLKTKGRPPKRPLGDGYDSEASDREIDPAIEEELILRLPPGDDAAYIRKAIIDKKIGAPLEQGGADINLRFFHQDGRRAALHVRKHIYAATVVDLPCIIEGMKSWDKRGWWKAADIAQMLWAYKLVKNDEEAQNCELPKEVDTKTFQYPHGLTPPMHYVRRRRFRPRMRKEEIEAVEDEVERLIKEDEKAHAVEHYMVEYDDALYLDEQRDSNGDGSDEEDIDGEEELDEEGEHDGEGELDDTIYAETYDDASALELNEFEAALAGEIEAADGGETEDQSPLIVTPSQMVGTPQADGAGQQQEADMEGEEEEDSGDESIEEEEIDEEDAEEAARIQIAKDDIADLEAKVRSEQAKLHPNVHPVIRQKVDELVKKFKQEIQLKKSALGLDDEF